MDDQAAPRQRSAASAAASPTTHLFAAQQAALAELMSGMDAEARWVLLIGEPRSGKSTVIRALLDELRVAAVSVAVVETTKAARVDQLANVIREHLRLPHKRTLIGSGRSIADIVASQSARRTPLVVVVDDAHALPTAGIEWLARLARASRPDSACYVVLAGTPAVEKAASRAWPTGRSGSIFVRSVLKPMTSAEVRRYVEQRSLSGGDASVKFSAAAIEKLETYSKGRPGRLAELCAQAMKLPATRITSEVSGDAVTEAAERLALGGKTVAAERQTGVERGSRRLPGRRAGAAIATTVLAVLFMYLGIRVGLRLTGTTTSWLWSEPARDRSGSDVVRSPNEGVRREPQVSVERGPGQPASMAPAARPRGDQRSAERPARVITAAPPAQPIAAIMARAREGEFGELTRLIGSGVSPNVRDVGGFTPLMAAVVNGQLPAARFLLDRGADVNVRAHGDITALMLAVINDRHEAVKLLLERGADVNAQSGAGWTALTFAAWKSDAALERVLLSHGAKPNVTDKQGWRPVEYAPPKATPADISSRVDR
jgi:type II secretory pathway predicted ATPase ExeA